MAGGGRAFLGLRCRMQLSLPADTCRRQKTFELFQPPAGAERRMRYAVENVRVFENYVIERHAETPGSVKTPLADDDPSVQNRATGRGLRRGGAREFPRIVPTILRAPHFPRGYWWI